MMLVESLTVWWLQYLRGAWKWVEDTTVQGSDEKFPENVYQDQPVQSDHCVLFKILTMS